MTHPILEAVRLGDVQRLSQCLTSTVDEEREVALDGARQCITLLSQRQSDNVVQCLNMILSKCMTTSGRSASMLGDQWELTQQALAEGDATVIGTLDQHTGMHPLLHLAVMHGSHEGVEALLKQPVIDVTRMASLQPSWGYEFNCVEGDIEVCAMELCLHELRRLYNLKYKQWWYSQSAEENDQLVAEEHEQLVAPDIFIGVSKCVRLLASHPAVDIAQLQFRSGTWAKSSPPDYMQCPLDEHIYEDVKLRPILPLIMGSKIRADLPERIIYELTGQAGVHGYSNEVVQITPATVRRWNEMLHGGDGDKVIHEVIGHRSTNVNRWPMISHYRGCGFGRRQMDQSLDIVQASISRSYLSTTLAMLKMDKVRDEYDLGHRSMKGRTLLEMADRAVQMKCGDRCRMKYFSVGGPVYSADKFPLKTEEQYEAGTNVMRELLQYENVDIHTITSRTNWDL